tara:strand:- start:492 stop:839 length:348 start_codon:yes stop_codon:yes gene_type:complete
MPILNGIKRKLAETLKDNISSVVIGFDTTPATSFDGALGQPAATLTPTVRLVDDSTVLVEARLPMSDAYNRSISEVFIQYKDSTSTFVPVARFTIRPIVKDSSTEAVLTILLEVR